MQKSKPVDAVDILHGILMSGGVATVPEAEQVAEIINYWKCGSCAVIFYQKHSGSARTPVFLTRG